MMQRLLYPRTCEDCGAEYKEVGYWGDGHYCLSCSLTMRRREDERKKDLARHAAEIAEKYGLDLDVYAEELPIEIRKIINPKNAGRKAVKWNSSYCELLVGSAAEGKSEAEFAAEVNIAQSLIQAWTEAHPKFKQARETANELRMAYFERTFRDAMLGSIPCVPSMMIRYMAAKYGWGDKNESVVSAGSGEIPVVKIVERDAAFPEETLEPSKEQVQAAGLGA